MYEITDYTKKQAKSLGVLVQPSKKTGKKIDVIRELYKKRHEEDRHKDGTPSYYADKLLW